MDGHTPSVVSYPLTPTTLGSALHEPPTQTMQKLLMIGLLLAPVFVASCANNPEAHDATSSAAVPTAPKVVFDVEGMT
jgi:hypothetical protein